MFTELGTVQLSQSQLVMRTKSLELFVRKGGEQFLDDEVAELVASYPCEHIHVGEKGLQDGVGGLLRVDTEKILDDVGAEFVGGKLLNGFADTGEDLFGFLLIFLAYFSGVVVDSLFKDIISMRYLYCVSSIAIQCPFEIISSSLSSTVNCCTMIDLRDDSWKHIDSELVEKYPSLHMSKTEFIIYSIPAPYSARSIP